jgi:hypothetical protein
MRFAQFVALGVWALAACKGDPHRPDAADQPILDAYSPPWFHPTPGEHTNWDIQLAAPYTLTAEQRSMMIVELFDVVPSATTLDYGDGAPVTVAAGSQPTAIADLKARGTAVICHVGTGAIKLTDPDAMKFPGYEASPPNRPDAVAAGSVIGWSTTMDDANVRFLDIRAGSRPQFEKYIMKRIELAKQIGCDGIAAHHNDAVQYQADLGTGFPMIQAEEERDWVVALAQKAHDPAIQIAIGGRGGYSMTGFDALIDDYDFMIAERCTEIPDCDAAKVMINYQRAVFALDYDVKQNGTTYNKALVCQEWTRGNVDGVIKKPALDGSFRETCP